MSGHAAPLFPQELFDAIIDLLAADWRSLAACALASSAQTSRARFHLSRRIDIKLELSPIDSPDSDAHYFMNTFTPGSSLAELPLTLLISGEHLNKYLQTPVLPRTLRLNHLSNLRSLKLSRFDIFNEAADGVAWLRSLYGSLERLEELHIDRIQVIPPDPPRPTMEETSQTADTGEEVLEPRHMPLIKILRIHMFKVLNPSSTKDPVIAAVRDDILVVPLHTALHTLSIQIYGTGDSLSGWTAVVARSRNTLREVRVMMGRPLSDEEDAPFYAALGECPGLQSLSLSALIGIGGGSSCTCLPIITSVFAPLPTFAFARTMRELSLAIPCRPPNRLKLDTSPDSAGLAAFSQIFLPDAYPALTDLRVTENGGPLEYEDLWMFRDAAGYGASALDDLLERISTALDPLRDAGVRVDVGRGKKSMVEFIRDSA